MNLEQRQIHIKKVEDGDKARIFLASSEWKEFVKPIIDSMIKGLVDIRELKSADLESDKKASVEVKARKLAAEYIESIEKLLEGFVIDGDVHRKMIEREVEANDVYKIEE